MDLPKFKIGDIVMVTDKQLGACIAVVKRGVLAPEGWEYVIDDGQGTVDSPYWYEEKCLVKLDS
jgi:hypothetical protein